MTASTNGAAAWNTGIGGFAAAVRREPGWIFGAISLVAAAFFFVGLSSGGFWADELFTVFVVDHHGGVPEVLARALTDTQPPGYYVVLHGWARVFGRSEAALRALSGVLCVAALAVFGLGTSKAFSPRARLFTIAAAATSPFLFVESQEARNYALCLFLSALLLDLAMRARAAALKNDVISPLVIAGLCIVGAMGAAVHFYEFVTVGLVYLFLIVTIPRLTLRLVLVGAGAVILAAQLAYIRTLLESTQQSLHAMWFRSDSVFFLTELLGVFKGLCGPGTLVALLAISAHMARSGPSTIRSEAPSSSDTAWTRGLAATVMLGIIGGGIFVSLAFTPSFSARNVLVASPFVWPVVAGYFDAAQRRADRPWAIAATVIPVAALMAQLGFQAERWLPRSEAWRESARFVLATPGCGGQIIPVVLPARFAPATPFFRTLFERHFYGYYFTDPSRRLQAFRAEELTDKTLNPSLQHRLGAAAGGASCPVLAWAVHDIEEPAARRLADHLAAAASAPPARVNVIAFESYRQVWGYVLPSRFAFVWVKQTPTAGFSGAKRLNRHR